MRINQELEEKENHLHYPACLGRMQEIEKQSFGIFVYTAIVFLIFGIFSFAGARFNIFAVLPDLLFDGEGLKIALFQIFEFGIVTTMAVLGCSKYKIFDVILMLMYALMIMLSVVCNYSNVDIVVFLAGIGGLWKSCCSLRIWSDYDQLSHTEGFPIFSLILTEHEERVQNSGNSTSQSIVNNTINQIAPSTGLAQSLIKVAANNSNEPDNMGMPSIGAPSLPENRYTMKRYMPEGEKESGIIASPMKFNI